MFGLILKDLSTGQPALPLTKPGTRVLLTHAPPMESDVVFTHLPFNGLPSLDPPLSLMDPTCLYGMLTMITILHSLISHLSEDGKHLMPSSMLVMQLFAASELTRTMLLPGTKLLRVEIALPTSR